MGTPSPRRLRRTVAVVTAVTLAATVAGAASAEPGGNLKAGFQTSVAAMVKAGADAPAGVVIDPIISVGDTLDSGFLFDSIPDGISFVRQGKGRVDLYVNHETSLVPFPVPLTDYTNSHVDLLGINQKSAGVLDGIDVIPSDANFQRFCSNYIATEAEGFDRPILFTNEEATDIVNREGLAWPAPSAFGSQPEQAGVVVALDVESGEYRAIYGMGRHNHENSLPVPGYDDLVVLSGDDTFSAPASQLYSYIAPDTDAVWNDEGRLWAFVGEAGYNDYGDMAAGDDISGHFIEVPVEVAQGDQNVLEAWSNANNVFQFIRIEDLAYDRTDPHVIYFADTGEPRAIPNATTGRLQRGPSGTMGPYPNGRIFRMELDDSDPTQVDSLTVLIDADPLGPGNPAAMHQPDNVETTGDSLLIQEDPGSHNQFALSNPNGVGARVWRYDLSTGALDAVLEVDQSLDEKVGYDVDSAAAANRGAWESSGIIDASSIWGPGWFLLDVQAGSLILQSETGMLGDRAVTFEREGGQLLRVQIPGS
jgi:hypothetical protein